MSRKPTLKPGSQLSVYLDCNILKHSSPIQSLNRHKKFTIKRNHKSSFGQKERNCFSGVHRDSLDGDFNGDTLLHPFGSVPCELSPAELLHMPDINTNLTLDKNPLIEADAALQKIRRKKKIDSRRQQKIELKILKDFHPYVQNVDTVKLVLAHLRPVKGPNQSIVQSIGKYKQDNLENVEVVMKNLKFSSFEQALDEYTKRIGAPKGSFLFIVNSKERNIRTVLENWGWIQNKNRNSNYFHLKWVCNDIPLDYKSIEHGQKFNHFDRNKELTNKNSLQKNLRKNATELLMPETFDIESYEELRMFQVQYQRQLVFSYVKYFIEELESTIPFYYEKVKTNKFFHKSLLIPGRKKQKSTLDPEALTLRYLNLLMESKVDEDFSFPILYLLLVCRFCNRIIDQLVGTQTKGIFAFNQKQWTKNRSSLHNYLTNRQCASLKQKSLLGTPSTLLIREFIKIQIILSVMLKKEWVGYGSNNLWIVKPVGVSRGTGIAIHRDKEKLLQSKNSSKLIQKYIERPLIFRDTPTVNLAFAANRKFDLRQWVLVTSFRPLEIYRFNKCYVRLCSEKYQLNDFRNTKQHLTNYSQNKFFFSKKEESVLSQEQLKTLLGNTKKWAILERKIDNIILKTLESTCEQIVMHPSCFEMYGFDIIVDERFEPWLLEVNLSPACQQRTDWMAEYIRQMSEGLLKIVLPQNLTPKDNKPNHWCKMTSKQKVMDQNTPRDSLSSIANNQMDVNLIRRLQIRWRIIKEFQKQSKRRVKSFKQMRKEYSSLQLHNDIELSLQQQK